MGLPGSSAEPCADGVLGDLESNGLRPLVAGGADDVEAEGGEGTGGEVEEREKHDFENREHREHDGPLGVFIDEERKHFERVINSTDTDFPWCWHEAFAVGDGNTQRYIQ